MDIIIQFVHTDKDSSIETLVKEKLENLKNKFDFVISAEVFFKEEKANIEKGKICDMRLSLPGPRVHASSVELKVASMLLLQKLFATWKNN